MKETDTSMARTAFECMFDLGATAARAHMADTMRASRARARRDVSPGAAFEAAGALLWSGIAEVQRRHPELRARA